ncbi:MAG: hypothetical protein Q9190_003335 [Brigantiaea leucoxantha]
MTQAVPQFADKTVEDLSWLGRWASIAMREQLKEIQFKISALPNPRDRNELAPIACTLHHDQKVSEEQIFKVGIIGAGAAGLFTGMIFDHLKEKYHLDVDYEILEANDEARKGGRLYSHYFKKPPPEEGSHDYYDVGAMRFPDSKVMSPTFKLFETLGMRPYEPSKEKVAKEGWHPKPGDLVRYYLRGTNTVDLYNDVQVPIPEEGPLTATAQSFNVTGLPSE